MTHPLSEPNNQGLAKLEDLSHGGRGPGASRLTELPAVTAGSKLLQWTILAALLAVCLGFPLVQAIKEISVDKESPHILRLLTRVPTKENLHAWDQSARDRNIFSKSIRPIILQWQYDFFGDLGSKAIAGKEDWLFYKPDIQALVQPAWNSDRFYHDTFDTTLSSGKTVNVRNPFVAISKFRNELASRGIQLLLLPIPGKPTLYPEKLVGHPLSGIAPLHDFIAALRQNDFLVIDVLTPLEKTKQTDSQELYLRRDTHWTPAGIECVANAVASEIKPFLGDSLVKRIYRQNAVRVNRQGDIVEMTNLPKRHQIWQPQPVSAIQIIDSLTGERYRDDLQSPILWLGDSFSRIYQTDEPHSAGLIAHVAAKLGIPLSSLVNDGGASTAVRQQLLRRPELLKDKKVVVWEFVERDIRFGKDGWQLLPLPEAI